MLTALALAVLLPQTAPLLPPPPPRGNRYLHDPRAFAEAYDRAMADARRDEQRILLLWGEDPDPIALSFLDEALVGQGKVWKRLHDDYRVVRIDPTSPSAGPMQTVLGCEPGSPGPWLTVVATDNTTVAECSAQTWRPEDGWDVAGLRAVLDEHRVAERDARRILAAAVAEAKRDGQRLFLHLAAPW